MVNLKGRVPQKLHLNPLFLAKLFRYKVTFVMVLSRNQNQNLSEIENRSILFLCDGFRKTVLGIDLIANAFRRSIQNTKLFSIVSSLIFCSTIYLFEKTEGDLFLLALKG